jgi:simple sugar transport system ATP-binding protein
LIDLRNAGAAVLVISEDLDELYAICDRLAVLARGRLSDALPTAQLAIEKVGMWMTGEFDARGIYVHG